MLPELKNIGAKRRVLPYGRYLASLEELEGRYAPEGNSNRRAIWEAFLSVNDLMKQVFGSVAEAWIGGSFITSETEPHDIDVVYLVTEATYFSAANTGEGRFVIDVLLRKNKDVPKLNDRVDAYLLPVSPTKIGYVYNYVAPRGYWDQFWSKTRFEEGNDRWLYPAAGYVEVMLDGYDN